MILTYHLIFPDSYPKDYWNAGNVIRIRDFTRQIRYLKKHYQILPLEAYVDVFFSNSSQLNKTIALTFDDCGHRTFSLVEPVLSRGRRLPATFFCQYISPEGWEAVVVYLLQRLMLREGIFIDKY